jgi:adenosylmethionine-8-amino-7-oxononanoate aminotransferase
MSGTATWLAQDAQHLWHPFTQMKLWPDEPPLVIQRAEGNWLIDSEGRRYFDGVSSLWVTVHGHNHPAIVEAICQQAGTLDHSTLLGLTHPTAAELAGLLAGMTPQGLEWCFYSECGSSAVEIALKIAFQYWQQRGYTRKKTFVSLENAYHGDTLGAVSVGGMELFHEAYGPLLFPVHRLPQPHCRKCRLGLSYPQCRLACADLLEDILQDHAMEIAGLIVEPRVQGAAGMIVQPPGYLGRLREICRKYDVLFIADEVATGFGRTGEMFACGLEHIRPDLLCLGKGLTGGTLPLAATLASQRIYEAFLGEYHEFKTFFHGHTYTGNPMACAAALANLKLMESEGFMDALPGRIEYIRKGLEEIAALEHVVEVRQQGMMVGVELAQDAEKDQPYPVQARMGHRVIMACRRHGVIIRPLGDSVILMPPLASSWEELGHLLDALKKSITQVTGG